MIHLTINGQNIEVPEGTTVMCAAQSAGIHIPSLCDHPAVTPYGGCRLCVVEVEGFRTPTASCTLPASNGMVVHTDTEKLRQTRQFILSMLFSERNHFCPFCLVSGGDCELQNAAYDEGMTHWPIQPNWLKFPVDTSHPYIVLDNNRCILCRRCVRACAELVGVATLGMQSRGSETLLVADTGVPFGESTCISCGTCVQVCPTGALMDKESAYKGLEKDLTRTPSICVGCSVGCGIQVLTRDGQLVRIEGDWDNPVNNGVLCEVGRYKALQRSEERLKVPMIRRDGTLQPASWDEALAYTAEKLKGGAAPAAALVSTRLPVEDIALFEKIFRQELGCELVTCIEEGYTHLSEQARQGAKTLPFEGKLNELREADGVVLIGANMSDYHQVPGFFIRRQAVDGFKLVIIDPQPNPLDDRASHVLKCEPGCDIAMLQGLAAAIRSSGGLRKAADIVALQQHPEEMRETLSAAGKDLAGCRKVAIVYGKGITMQDDPGVLTALLALAETLSQHNPQPAAVISVKGKANSLAADQLGLTSAFRPKADQPVFLALGDDLPSKRQLKNVRGLPFIAVQSAYANAITEIADVILPATTWTEAGGHYLNLDGRLQEAKQMLAAPAGVRSNHQVLQDLAAQLGVASDVDWQARLVESPALVRLEL